MSVLQTSTSTKYFPLHIYQNIRSTTHYNIKAAVTRCNKNLISIFLVYYDVPAPVTPPGESPREEHDGIVEMIMDFSSRIAITRLFQIKISQIPFSQRAPAGCMQYFTDVEGIIQVICGIFVRVNERNKNIDYRNFLLCIPKTKKFLNWVLDV